MIQQGTFKAVGSKERLVDRVVNELEGMIVNGQLEPETKLPPERELAEQLGVSRTALREAVQILVTKGLLGTKPGVGTTVQQMGNEHVVKPLSLLLRTRTGGEISFDHMHQVRTMLEVEVAWLAASQATPADIAQLRQIVAKMEAAGDNLVELASLDTDFHRTLVKMTGNPLLLILQDSIRDLLNEYINTVTLYLDPRQDVLPPHYAIVDAIAATNPEHAREAMYLHQQQMRKNHEKYLLLSQAESNISI
ncbi:MAG: putative L-lactate dehydrogenase operon regulatory protein [Anaerolineae bacterium]|nr:putative L-lactate dehydrogenase operon regulatory protein [Anaerolineae bacterium]